MATAPLFNALDGTSTTVRLEYTTNQERAILTGTLATNTVAVQISVNGGAYVSDPTLVLIDTLNHAFTIPNLANYPSGILLELGVNTLLVRAIDLLGQVSAPSTALITRVQDLDFGVGVETPTAVRVLRRRDSVDILAARPNAQVNTGGFTIQTAEFRGFNIYASTTPTGTSGYYLINASLVTTASTVYQEDSLSTVEDLTTWGDNNRKNVRIRVSEEDEFGNELAVRLDTVHETTSYYERTRFSSSLESYVLTSFLSFRHYRAGGPAIINEDQFTAVPDSSPLYYVVTAVYYDSTLNQLIETPYSQEVLGQPLVLDTTVRDLPGRTELQIVVDYINAVLRVNSEISLLPGSTTRDVSIDPFSSEGSRLWFLLDFVHRSQSFLTLLQIDDPNGDGTSDPVAQTAYKVALRAAVGYSTDGAVQTLIDQQFDKLAANVHVTRLPGRASVGEVVLYTTNRPTVDLTVPAGTFVSAPADTVNNLPAVRYRIGGTYVLVAANADAYYNFTTKRYELIASVTCETIGTSGNRPAGSITQLSGVTGFKVTNTEATVFGTDVETNADLATRSVIAFASVDTGTAAGYAAKAAAQLGILKAKVVKSGDTLMMRDWDPIRKKHIGGKVDVWIQGVRERTVTNVFAFAFEQARDITCAIVSATNLIFRVLDSRVTVQTPLIEILNNPVQGLGVRNATKGQDYDLTGVTILDYQTFQLNNMISQPVTDLDDIVLADYRFRSVSKLIPPIQPVRRVISVVGAVSGALATDTNWKLYKTEDPLLEGESTQAQDYVSITQYGGRPSGNQVTVSNELHVLIGAVQEPLDSIGINTATIRVFSADRLTEYDGPEAVTPDFAIIDGTATTPVRIVRTTGSAIMSGQNVSVDYTSDENFTVTYVVNDVLQQLQQTYDQARHVTADVLVKQAPTNPIDIETTVQLKRGATSATTDPSIRTNVSLELDRKLIGQGSAQSDVINSVDSTAGVDYEIVPLAKMAYADGAQRLRESVLSASKHLVSLDSGGQVAYILINALAAPTTDLGALPTEHSGVFMDDQAMVMSSTLALVGQNANQAFIIGAQGAVIVGYTDDATLIAEGYTTADQRAEELLVRTANHVVVALPTGETPAEHTFACSYVVRGDKGARDIIASDVEVITLGALVVTYREAT